MAYSDFTGTIPVDKPALKAGWLTSLRSAVARRALYSRTVRELSNLSSRELADLGLTRCTIAKVAHEAAYGK
jgi:uncharacterized protein YjiS (DUF1127 family)